MDEFELIRQYFTRTLTDSDVRIGIGDDGALLRPAAGRDLITVVDTLVEGVHYPLNMAAADIAWRAVAVNLSDIAAMGARPRWMTLALTLREADPNWLAEFSDGLFAAAAEHDVSLVGCDTTRGRQVVVSIQIRERRTVVRAVQANAVRDDADTGQSHLLLQSDFAQSGFLFSRERKTQLVVVATAKRKLPCPLRVKLRPQGGRHWQSIHRNPSSRTTGLQ